MIKKIKCEVWSRVVGFYRPIDQTNPGKKSEMLDRKLYDVSNLGEIVHKDTTF